MPILVTGLLLGVMAAGPSSPPQAKRFPTGRLIENLVSDSAPDQKFTVYVPTRYDGSRALPVLYLMDPRGRARVPAKLFQAAAERYGYLLVSSHNTSSDRPMEPNLRALQAMWDDSHAWFRIDPRRVYLAGFSGTARTVSLLAHHKHESITGIIGAGAGFHPDVSASDATQFLYFGTVGDVDYNFHEIEALEHALTEQDAPHRIERFAGPHSWMPPHLAMRAIEWMELRAMRDGSRLQDQALLDAWWRRDEAAARERLTAVRPLSAARRYAAMVRDYEGLRDTSEATALAMRYAATTTAKDELRRRQAESRRSNEWVRSAMQTIANAYAPGASAPNLPVESLAQTLEVPRLKATAASLEREAALEAQRRLNQIEVQLGFYLPEEALEEGDLSRAVYYLTLAMQINDTSPVGWYLMAETFSRLESGAQALAALRRAIDAGFRDLALMESDPDFRRLRTDPAYGAIVDLLRQQGDRLDPLTVDRPPLLFK